MQATRRIVAKIQEALKAKITDLSLPVLRTTNGVIQIAMFVIEKKSADETETNRPDFYLLLNVGSGEVELPVTCHAKPQNDFSREPYDKKYSSALPDGVEITEETLDELYEAMDGIRQMILEGVEASTYLKEYQEYMKKVLRIVPPSLCVFYRELSNLSGGEPAQRERAEEQVQPETIKTYDAKDTKWKFSVSDLSTVPQSIYSIAERIADNFIKFLPCDKPGFVRFEYPLLCTALDQKTSADPWMELTVRSANGGLSKGHFRSTSKKSIYTTCGKGQNGQCIFGCCPYVIAAYIRYLTDYDPKELARQRRRYKENRLEIDEKQLHVKGYDIPMMQDVEKEKALAGLSLLDNGRITVRRTHEYINLSWCEDLGPKGMQLQTRDIPFAEFSKPVHEIRDLGGNEVKEEFLYAAKTYCLIASGKWKGYIQKGNPKAEPENASAKKKDVDEPSQRTDAEQRTRDTGEQRWISKSSAAYRCASNQSIKSFYGCYQVTDKNAMESTLNELYDMLSRKGVKNVRSVVLKDLSYPLQTDTLYIVESLKSEHIPEALQIFSPGDSIVLCGTKQELDFLLNDPIVRSIYGMCYINGPQADILEVYRTVTRLLPEHLKSQINEDTERLFVEWAKTRTFPSDVLSAAELIAWQCQVDNSLVFAKQKWGNQRTWKQKRRE